MIDIIYTKMCEKAIEIQNLKPKVDIEEDQGNWYYGKVGDIDRMFFCVGFFFEEEVGEDDIWLPRQDQLQEIYRCNWLKENKRYQMQRYLVAFNDWWSKGRSSFTNKEGLETFFETFEQCGLAMIMKEMFNKTWNGEDWI